MSKLRLEPKAEKSEPGTSLLFLIELCLPLIPVLKNKK